MAYCDRCERWFPHDRALEQHKEDSDFHWPCDDCHLDFESADVRQQHYVQSPNHYFCKECDRHFNSQEARIRHMSSKHWYCRVHDEIFKSNARLQSHCKQSSDHHYCVKCEHDFDDEDQLWGHAVEDHHACRECHELFDDYQELQEHDRDEHDFCTDCNRVFQNSTNLWHHLSSKHHQPATVRCPGRGCKKSFVSYGALVLHVESGACPSGMTRDQLNRFIVRRDTLHYITNCEQLIEDPLDGCYEPPPSMDTWATERPWNGEAYECFMCGGTFETLARLNKHLQSPPHAQKIYRCPKSDCRTEFATFSGLYQHVEGGTCGVRVFRQVRDVMGGLTRGLNTLTV